MSTKQITILAEEVAAQPFESEQECLEAIAPWAAEFEEVHGGWVAFESMADVEIWRNQT